MQVCLALIGSTGDQRRGLAGSEIVLSCCKLLVLCNWVEAHTLLVFIEPNSSDGKKNASFQ